MKVLLDTCLSRTAKEALVASGHKVVWGGDWSEDPGDEAILALASKEDRVVVTLDKDFGELAIRRKLPHCGILRLVGFKTNEQGAVSQRVLVDHGDDLLKGAIVTAEPGRVRIRYPLDKQTS
ncbi:MAG: DUF5615 family PIN-like protein [Terriglobia bacterium]